MTDLDAIRFALLFDGAASLAVTRVARLTAGDVAWHRWAVALRLDGHYVELQDMALPLTGGVLERRIWGPSFGGADGGRLYVPAHAVPRVVALVRPMVVKTATLLTLYAAYRDTIVDTLGPPPSDPFRAERYFAAVVAKDHACEAMRLEMQSLRARRPGTPQRGRRVAVVVPQLSALALEREIADTEARLTLLRARYTAAVTSATNDSSDAQTSVAAPASASEASSSA